MNAALLAVALKELPAAIRVIKDLFVKENPNVPAPTDEEIIAAYQQALTTSLAKAARWQIEHPPPTT